MAFHHFAGHYLHELTHFDTRIFRTLRYLLSSPGFLTSEYLAGRRRRYIAPLRLYLTCFALMLFVYSTYHPIYDFNRISELDKSGQVSALLHRFSQKTGTAEPLLLERLNERWHFYMSASEVVDALVMATLLALVYWTKKRYFAEHMITALYFLSFSFLLSPVTWVVWNAFGGRLAGPLYAAKGAVVALVVLGYLWLSLRRVYHEGVWLTVLKTLIVLLGVEIAILIGNALSLVLALVHTYWRPQ